jgi:hypothetical protein
VLLRGERVLAEEGPVGGVEDDERGVGREEEGGVVGEEGGVGERERGGVPGPEGPARGGVERDDLARGLVGEDRARGGDGEGVVEGGGVDDLLGGRSMKAVCPAPVTTTVDCTHMTSLKWTWKGRGSVQATLPVARSMAVTFFPTTDT